MKNAVITEAFGHGFASLKFAKAYGLTPVAFSEKATEEAFTAEVNQIYNNLVAFAPNMVKASWEERESWANGWNVRQDILTGKITPEMWMKFATIWLSAEDENLPMFEGLDYRVNVMFVPQKLRSDNCCGVTAAQQSLTPECFDFLKKSQDVQLVLGQHFHKVNDLPKVEALVDSFKCYVPGMTEDKEVFGIRGIEHVKYYHLYQKLSASVGIAGTHTWYMLTCFPEIPQIILYNKNLVEPWEEIAKAYQKSGYRIYALGFDENTNIQELSKEMEKLYQEL